MKWTLSLLAAGFAVAMAGSPAWADSVKTVGSGPDRLTEFLKNCSSYCGSEVPYDIQQEKEQRKAREASERLPSFYGTTVPTIAKAPQGTSKGVISYLPPSVKAQLDPNAKKAAILTKLRSDTLLRIAKTEQIAKTATPGRQK